MADKDKEKEQQYVVTADFLGTLTRGDVRPADGLPDEPEALIKDGSIRLAKASETEEGATWVDEPDQGAEERRAEAEKAARASVGKEPATSSPASPASDAATKTEVTHG